MLIPPLGFITANFGDIPFIPELIMDANISPHAASGSFTGDYYVSQNERHIFTVFASDNTPQQRYQINRFSMSEAGNMRTLAQSGTRNLAALAGWGGGGECIGLNFSADGTKMIVLRKNGTNAAGHQFRSFTLGTPFDLSTLVWDGVTGETFDNGEPLGVEFSADGTKMIVLHQPGAAENYRKRISEYTLLTPWDISTRSLVDTTDFYHIGGTGGFSLNGIFADATGETLYIPILTGNNYVSSVIVKLGTPWAVASATEKKTVWFGEYQAGTNNNRLTTVAGKNTIYSNNAAWTNLGMRYRRVELSAPLDQAGYENLDARLAPVTNATSSVAHFNADGTRLYTMSSATQIAEHLLNGPYDLASPILAPTITTLPVGYTGQSNFCFSADGTKLYTHNSTQVITYNLTAPYTIAGASVGAVYTYGITGVTRMAFTPDGLHLILGGATLTQFDLAVAWDVSTATNSGKTFVPPVSNQGSARSMAVRGSKLYLIVANSTGLVNHIYQYNFGVDYDVTTLTLHGSRRMNGVTGSSTGFAIDNAADPVHIGNLCTSVTNYVTPGEFLTPGDVTTLKWGKDFNFTPHSSGGGSRKVLFSDDGMRAYYLVAAASSATIEQYGLTTAFDLSTVDTIQTVNMPANSATCSDMLFLPGGTAVLVLNRSNQRIYRYALSVAWDITTITTSTTFLQMTGMATTNGMFMSADGTKVYVTANAASSPQTLTGGADFTALHQFDLGTPFDITTATLTRRVRVAMQTFRVARSTDANNIYGVTFSSDGSKLFIGNNITGYYVVTEISLSTPWDISTLSKEVKSVLIPVGYGSTGNLTMSADDNTLYLAGSPIDSVSSVGIGIKRLALIGGSVSTLKQAEPFVTSAALGGNANQGGILYDAQFNADGSKFIFTAGVGALGRIVEMVLQTPYDIDTASLGFVAAAPVTNTPFRSISWGSAGNRLYGITLTTGIVHQFNIATAYSLVTLSNPNQSMNISGLLTADTFNGIMVSQDNTKLYVLYRASSVGRIASFTFGTPGDITTLTYDGLSIAIADDTNPTSFAMSADGTRLYVGGNTTKRLYVYELMVPFDPLSITALRGDYEFGALANPANGPLTANGLLVQPDGQRIVGLAPAGSTNGYFFSYSFTQPPIE